MLTPPRLMLVTDRRWCPPRRLPFVISAAITAGVDAVQLREPGMPREELATIAHDLRRVTGSRAQLFINGDAALAHDVGVGVHFGERATEPADLPPGLVVSRAVHSVAAARAAEERGADLLVLGTIYTSRTHPGGETGGPALVRQVAAATSLPIVAIGGISAENAGEVIQAGAAGVAVITAILAAGDLMHATRRLRAAVDAALRERGSDAMITVTVNGVSRTLDEPLPLLELIEQLQISHPRIAVALNGTVLRREEHAATMVRDGDSLEIVRMVGGG